MKVKDIVRLDPKTQSKDPDVIRCIQNQWYGVIKTVKDIDANDGIVVIIPKAINGVDPKFGDVGNKEIKIDASNLIIVDSELMNVKS